MALENISDKIVFEKVEKELYKFKSEFTPRTAFGGLYGALKTNSASLYCVRFFIDELKELYPYLGNTQNKNKNKKIINFIGSKEAFELILAASQNTVLSRSQLNEFIDQNLVQLIQKNWSAFMNHSPKNL